MNALVHKEIRGLLPAWGCAMALAILPVWLLWPGPYGMLPDSLGLPVFAPFALGVLLLSLTPFGQELNWGTFSVLLSQPVSRRRLWVTKTLLLAAALGLVFITFCISNQVRVDSILEATKHTTWRSAFSRPVEDTQIFLRAIAGARHQAFGDTLLIGGLVALGGFAGGLWTTLLFRQVTAAFWLTFLVPIGLGLLAGKVLEYLPEGAAPAGLLFVMGAYAVAGFIYAKRLFVNVQDTQWTGGIISLPSLWGAGGGAASGVRRRKPVLALLRKEIQAQHVNLLLAGGLILLHLAVIVVRSVSADYLASHRSLAMSLEAFPVLWLALPLLIGSVTVAEERKLGTHDTLLCSPAPRWVQFIAKLAVALVLGVFLGGVAPLLIEQLAGPRGQPGGPSGLYFLGEIRPMVFLQLSGAAALTLLAFYGSTLTRNTLQSMGAGLMAACLTCLVVALSSLMGNQAILLWRGPLIGFIGWPVLLVTIVSLAYPNFKQSQSDRRTWVRNGLTLLAVLVCVAGLTTTIYHRAWEAWQSEEPLHSFMPSIYPMTRNQHGMVDWEGLSSAPKMQASSFRKAVVLPDGRLWLQQRQVKFLSRLDAPQGAIAWYATGPSYTGFLAESNWKDVAVSELGIFGIQVDGGLWDLSNVQDKEARPKRVGSDRDWRQISGAGEHFSGLKADGTLWQWGRDMSRTSQLGPAPSFSQPAQVGEDKDWVAVCDDWSSSVAAKADGGFWTWDWNLRRPSQPRKWLTDVSSLPISLTLRNHSLGVVCADGTLWIGCDLTNSVYARFVGTDQIWRFTREMVRWGTDRDWKQICFVSWGRAVGVKRDGSLWQWDSNRGFGGLTGWVVPATMPSRYMDWVSTCADGNAFLALARDGSLCLWGDPEDLRFSDWNGPDPGRLLMPSRIKATRMADLSRQ